MDYYVMMLELHIPRLLWKVMMYMQKTSLSFLSFISTYFPAALLSITRTLSFAWSHLHTVLKKNSV